LDETAVVTVRWDGYGEPVAFDRERPEIFNALLDWANHPDRLEAQRQRNADGERTLRRIVGDEEYERWRAERVLERRSSFRVVA
jgi:hypothetical protein